MEVVVVGEAGGADPGGSVEGVDFEAGVVGEDDFTGCVVGVVACFFDGVALKGGLVFWWGGSFFQVGEWREGDVPRRGGGEVAEFAGVGGGDEEVHGVLMWFIDLRRRRWDFEISNPLLQAFQCPNLARHESSFSQKDIDQLGARLRTTVTDCIRTQSTAVPEIHKQVFVCLETSITELVSLHSSEQNDISVREYLGRYRSIVSPADFVVCQGQTFR